MSISKQTKFQDLKSRIERKKLSEMRKLRHTHQAIADYVGLSRSYITLYLNGYRPLPNNVVEKIERFINAS